jgi:hypothetical protein
MNAAKLSPAAASALRSILDLGGIDTRSGLVHMGRGALVRTSVLNRLAEAGLVEFVKAEPQHLAKRLVLVSAAGCIALNAAEVAE